MLADEHFYPRPPRGGRRGVYSVVVKGYIAFLSTSPAWGTTPPRLWRRRPPPDFYPRPPRGGRRGWTTCTASARNFYPRPPRGGRRKKERRRCRMNRISIHVPRVGDDNLQLAHWCCNRMISIHVPRVGDDAGSIAESLCGTKDFYPRPPRGGRLGGDTAAAAKYAFLSTSPAWGTTTPWRTWAPGMRHFYPRPPRGGRPAAESAGRMYGQFLSTSPAWGTTEEYQTHDTSPAEFLSTSPAWGTTQGAAQNAADAKFLSTSPAWGTTVGKWPQWLDFIISIHVPRVGDDGRTGA